MWGEDFNGQRGGGKKERKSHPRQSHHTFFPSSEIASQLEGATLVKNEPSAASKQNRSVSKQTQRTEAEVQKSPAIECQGRFCSRVIHHKGVINSWITRGKKGKQ